MDEEVKVEWTCFYCGHNAGEVSGLSRSDADRVLGKYARQFVDRVAVTKAEAATGVHAEPANWKPTSEEESPVAPDGAVEVKEDSPGVVNFNRGKNHRR